MANTRTANTTAHAGLYFDFVVSTSSPKLSSTDRKLVRSHVLRSRPRRGNPPVQRLWTNPDSPQLPDAYIALNTSSPVPAPVCPDLALVRYPEEMKPYMLRGLFHYMTALKTGLSPFEACAQGPTVENQFLNQVMQDAVFLHVVLFQVHRYFDGLQGLGTIGPVARLHLIKCLGLLQQRLGHLPAALSDATILSVSALAMASNDADDYDAAMNHVNGLRKIVGLRGGIRSLTHNQHRIQRKLCRYFFPAPDTFERNLIGVRVDLSTALHFGSKPVFFQDDMHWGTYLANTSAIRGKAVDTTVNKEIMAFLMQMIDSNLRNVWLDLWDFSRISNLAFQTQGKIEPSLVNEVMVSTMYRLLSLSFPSGLINETVRLGLTVFAASIFLKGQSAPIRHEHLIERYRISLNETLSATDRIPSVIKLWLVVMWTSITRPGTDDLWFSRVLDETSQELEIKDWCDAQARLKSVMWVDCIHDSLYAAFASKRLKR